MIRVMLACLLLPAALSALFLSAAPNAIAQEPLQAPKEFVGPMPKPDLKTDPKADANAPPAIPQTAHILAALALKQTPPEIHYRQRFFWIQYPTIERVKVATATINYVSRSRVVRRPLPLAEGRLIQIDLELFAPRSTDLAEWIDTWEKLAFDPTFSLLITKDQLDSLKRHPELVDDLPSYRSWSMTDDSFIDTPLLKVDPKIDVLRLNGPHMDQQLFVDLQDATSSLAPVVEWRYAMYRMLDAIPEKGLYRDVWGGLYYDFAGIRKAKAGKDSKDSKETDEDALFKQLGILDTAEKLFETLGSDQRVAVFQSDVTGKPRRADLFPVPSSRGGGFIGVTHDTKDQDRDIGQHPLLNLLTFKDAAREVIFTRANGINGYSLYNGQGELQTEVPFDVANDTTVPGAHTKRLRPAISCIACHEADGSDGWKPLKNDVAKLLGGGKKLEIFDDLSRREKSNADTLDRLAGLYGGSPDDSLRKARDTFAAAQLRVTGPWKIADPTQKDVVKTTGAEIVKEYNAFRYDLVYATDMLADLGQRLPKTKGEDEDAYRARAAKYLGEALKPNSSALVQGLFTVEDARIEALKNEIGINRFDAQLIYSLAAFRAQIQTLPMPKEAVKTKEIDP